MSLHESDDSPVSYIRSHRSDLNKVRKALKRMVFRMVFSDERRRADAEALNAYWKTYPDPNYFAIKYDGQQKVFVLSHSVEGQVTMTPEDFYEVAEEKVDFAFPDEVRNKSGKVRGKIERLMRSTNEK